MAGRFFWQPPAHTDPEVERKQSFDVYRVLRDVVGFTAAIRAEVRLMRRELQQQREEVKMNFEELSKNVEAFIEEAVRDVTTAVQAAAAKAVGGPSEGDMQVLSDKVTASMGTLRSTFATLPTTPPAGTVVVTDPTTGENTSAPTGTPIAPGDTVVAPVTPVDPNAPVA